MPRETSGTRAFLAVQHFRDETALSRDARRRGAPTLGGDLCSRHRNDTPFIATRKSIERSSPRANQQGEVQREGEREREKKKKRREPVGWSGFCFADGNDYDVFPCPGVSRYISCLPFASMVLSTLQKSLSTCCLSVSPTLYIRECQVCIFSVATSFYAFNIIKHRVTRKYERGLLIKSYYN